MDAYTVLKKIDSGTLIDENYFNQLKRDFRNDYLESKKYFERISLHRTPIDLKKRSTTRSESIFTADSI